MTAIIMDLQKNTGSKKAYVYHPVKDDIVDKKLGDFINAAPHGVRNNMKFVRESEGIYKYGKKRVFMKIEQDKIIIRVGGGYLTIEEFIDQYCLNDEEARNHFYGWVYGGACSGTKEFQTFYLAKRQGSAEKRQPKENTVEHETASDEADEEGADVVGELA